MRLLAVALTLIATVLLVLALAGSAWAGTDDPFTGAPWVNDCPALDAPCLALAERLESIGSLLNIHTDLQANISADTDNLTDLLNGHLDPDLDGNVPEWSASPGAVALSEGDQERLDLTWWGVWALVGLLFVLIMAPRWFSAFRVTRGS